MGMIQSRTNGHGRFDGYGIGKETITYAATVTLTAANLWALKNIIKIVLTGALEIDMPTSGIQEDQEVEFWLEVSGATDRTVTFDANTQDRGNCAIEGNTTAIVCFVFNGTTWVEKSRSVTAAS